MRRSKTTGGDYRVYVTGHPHSLVSSLRALQRDGIKQLLVTRPDLLTALSARGHNATLNDLATSARSERSLAQCLARLPQPAYRVLETILAVHTGVAVPLDSVAAALGCPVSDLDSPLDELRSLALVSGDKQLSPTPGVSHLIPQPAGLGPRLTDLFARRDADVATALATLSRELDLTLPPRAAAADLTTALTPAVIRSVAARLGESSHATLTRMAASGPLHQVPDSPALRALIDRGLLAVTQSTRTEAHPHLFVVMPREVALALRGTVYDGLGQPPADTLDHAPDAPLDTTPCYDIVRHLDSLRTWDESPPTALRSGGLPVREIRRMSTQFDCSEANAALVCDLATLAGYCAPDDGEWSLTSEYFAAATHNEEQRWAELAAVWVESPLGPGDNPATLASGPPGTPDPSTLRRCILDAWASPCPPEIALARAHWNHPFIAAHLTPDLLAHVAREALALGIAYHDGDAVGLTPWGRALGTWSLDEAAAATALAAGAPPVVDSLVVQGDLTLIVPGRPSPAVAAVLDWVKVESRGGALMARFTPDTVRAALSAGRDAEALLETLRRHSSAAVPQPLEYLVRDLANSTSRARVGRETTYVRGPEAMLDEVIASASFGALMAWRIAPTVLVSSREPAQIAALLREMGVTTQVEGPGGQLVDLASARPRPKPLRHTVTARSPLHGRVAEENLQNAAETWANALTADRSPELPGAAGSVPEHLEAAQARDEPISLGIVDAQGHTTQRTVRVVWVQGGRATLRDEATGAVSATPLHRIRLKD